MERPNNVSRADLFGVQAPTFIHTSRADSISKPWRRVFVFHLAFSILSAMIAAQCFLIGGFPLKLWRGWWLEPGAMVTVTISDIAAIAFMPGADFA